MLNTHAPGPQGWGKRAGGCVTSLPTGIGAGQLGGSAGLTRLDYILDDQDRRLVGVVVADADHTQCLMPEVNRLARAPVRHGAAE